MMGAGTVPAPILGRRVTSEPSAPCPELCYGVLERVCGEQGRQSIWVACACRQLPSLYWGLGPTTFLKKSLSHPVLSEGEKPDAEHVHKDRECCNSSELKQSPTWGKILDSFYFCRLPHSLKYEGLAVKIQTASAMPKGLIVVKIGKHKF